MFKKPSTNSSAERLIEESLYEQVALELSDGKRRNGLWAKALADSEGAQEKAEGLYIKYRVQSIVDELLLAEEAKAKNEKARAENEAHEHEVRQQQIQETHNKLEVHRFLDDAKKGQRFLAYVLFVFFGILTFTLIDWGERDLGLSALICGIISLCFGGYALTGKPNI